MNPHAGKLSSVYKLLVLGEILRWERPAQYWDCFAGRAAYPLSHSPARDYGVFHFLESKRDAALLRESSFAKVLQKLSPQSEQRPVSFPGSTLMAAALLGKGSRYWFFDTDALAVGNIELWTQRMGLQSHCHVAWNDGLDELLACLLIEGHNMNEAFVFLDPFSPFQRSERERRSTLSVFHQLEREGVRAAMFYAFDEMWESLWPARFIERTASARSWCGEVLLLDGPACEGLLGSALGCGLIACNLDATTVRRITDLSAEFAAAYREAVLPDGRTGSLEFRVVTH